MWVRLFPFSIEIYIFQARVQQHKAIPSYSGVPRVAQVTWKQLLVSWLCQEAVVHSGLAYIFPQGDLKPAAIMLAAAIMPASSAHICDSNTQRKA